jgi:Domain of unknown function(DUF2779)
MRYLTKSRFKMAVECPTKLYYTAKAEYANTNNENEFLAMLADGGFQVGELAKLMYPEGIEIKTKQVDVAVTETETLLQQENITLFEPAIVYRGYLVRVDVLVKRGQHIEIIEVKAKSFTGDPSSLSGQRKFISADMLPYIQDVAFQKFVVGLAMPQASVSTFLLMPDKSKRADVNGMNQWFKIRRNGRDVDVHVDDRARAAGLGETVLTVVSIDHLVNEVLNQPLKIPGGEGSMQSLTDLWAKHYAADVKLPPIIGAQCGSCEFKASLNSSAKSGFHECWKQANRWSDVDFKVGTVLDLWNFRGKDKLIKQGICKINQVTEEDLKLVDHDYSPLSNAQRQWMQIAGLPEAARAKGYYLDKDGLQSEIRNWTYPLHLIDFETAAVALPFHAGRSPYEQVAFQFSHHILQADGRLLHATQFLCDAPGEFPNYQFVRALREALRHDQGTIMRWSHHENSILNAIKDQLNSEVSLPNDKDELITFIECITNNGERSMVDLADVARKHYFHPGTKGSCSIKKVLPAVMQSSPYLKRIYAQPVYGAANGLVSLNFKDMTWWQLDRNGEVLDPYKLLMDKHEGDEDMYEAVNQGGAASNAYLRLQFEDLNPRERSSLRAALLRYCELDTLAMALILESWYDELKS